MNKKTAKNVETYAALAAVVGIGAAGWWVLKNRGDGGPVTDTTGTATTTPAANTPTVTLGGASGFSANVGRFYTPWTYVNGVLSGGTYAGTATVGGSSTSGGNAAGTSDSSNPGGFGVNLGRFL